MKKIYIPFVLCGVEWINIYMKDEKKKQKYGKYMVSKCG